MFKACILTLALLVSSVAVYCQNLKDDIVSNDLDGVQSKVELLSPDFKGFPYLAYYLKNTQNYQQEMLDYLIQKGCDANQLDDSGVNALFYAIRDSNLGAVKHLISAKANVNIAYDVDATRQSNALTSTGELTFPVYYNDDQNYYYHPTEYSVRPLWLALFSQDVDIVKALLSAGADPLAVVYGEKDPKQKKVVTNSTLDYVVGQFYAGGLSSEATQAITPTFFANAFNVWKEVSALPKTKQPILKKSQVQNIFAYFCSGDMPAFKAELVKTGENTLKFLPFAVLAENWDIVNLIYKYNKLEIDEPFDGKQSLLEWTLVNLHGTASKLLIDHGASIPLSISVENRNRAAVDWNPLNWAVQNQKKELVELLIGAKLDVNENFTLVYANASPEIREILVKNGADVNRSFTYSRQRLPATFLFDAANDGYPEAVQYYLNKGLNPNGLNDEFNPLIGAIKSGKPEIVKALLDKGADKDARVWNGQFFDFGGNLNLEYKTAREVALALAEKYDNALSKSRYNTIVRMLDKAEARPKTDLIPMVVVEGSPSGAFRMATTLVTQKQYVSVMNTNPGYPSGSSLPVTNVSWLEATKFCNALSQMEKLTPAYIIGSGSGVSIDDSATGYRLPTKEEWRFSARGGVKSKGFTFPGSNDVNEVAWNQVNSSQGQENEGSAQYEQGGVHPVALLKPNELGLYDMSGNVWELCEDLTSNGYECATVGGSFNVSESSFFEIEKSERLTRRDDGSLDVGFRVVRLSAQ